MEETKKETAITKILYNQVALIAGVVGVVFSAYIFITNPQRDTDESVNVVKAEFAAHEKLQAARDAQIDKYFYNLQNGDLKDLGNIIDRQQSEIDDMTKQIVKLQTIIEERIPAKK